jgi:hypothetical protein
VTELVDDLFAEPERRVIERLLAEAETDLLPVLRNWTEQVKVIFDEAERVTEDIGTVDDDVDFGSGRYGELLRFASYLAFRFDHIGTLPDHLDPDEVARFDAVGVDDAEAAQ